MSYAGGKNFSGRVHLTQPSVPRSIQSWGMYGIACGEIVLVQAVFPDH